MGGGYQPERVQAGFYLLLYTLLVSVGSTALPSFSKDVHDFDISVKESETTERLFPRDEGIRILRNVCTYLTIDKGQRQTRLESSAPPL